METNLFPPLATGTIDNDHIFLRVTQKLGPEDTCAFHLLNLQKLWSMVEIWANEEVNFFVKQDLSPEDEMKEQGCRYFLFRFKKPLLKRKPEQITFGAGEILNIGDILDIELESRPWMLFQALFGKFIIRVFLRNECKSEDLSQEQEVEVSPFLVVLPQNEFSYYVDESEPEGDEKTEIDSWLSLKDACSEKFYQENLLSKIEPQVNKFISTQQARIDKKKPQAKFMKGLVNHHQAEQFKSKTQIQKTFGNFDFLNSEKLKIILNN